MCRAKDPHGRRCPGCNAPAARAAHNRRRRENRVIQRGIVDWAREHDAGTAAVAELEAGGPAAAKEWAKKQGLDPVAFLGDEAPAPVATAPTPSPGADDDAPTVVRAAAAAGGGGIGRGGRARAVAPTKLPQRAWRAAQWATPEVQDQVEAIVQTQGDHRDERSLLAGSVQRATPAPGGSNETVRVELGNGMVGYHKSFSGLDDETADDYGQDSAQQPIHEVAAWHLAKQLGGTWEEIVPPVVIREINGQMGSFALERPGRTGSHQGWTASPEWRAAAFYDALIGQQDRHPNNYLVAGDRISLIDHGYAFARPGDYKNYSWFQDARIDAGSAALTVEERAALDRLLNSEDTLGMDRMLQPARAKALRARAVRMRSTGRLIDSGF